MIEAQQIDLNEESRIPGQYSVEELEGYFLLMKEAGHKYERHDVRRECFQVINGGLSE